MNKKDLWDLYVRKNPNLLSKNVELEASMMYKFFETTYDVAHDEGVRNGKCIAQSERTVSDIFSNIFKSN